MIRAPVLFHVMIVSALATSGMARAQDEPPAVVPIVLRPASAPVPALKYRLLPERSALVSGNAAIFYHRAVEMTLGKRLFTEQVKETNQKPVSDDQAVYEWNRGPITAIPLDQAHGCLDRHRSALHEVELGARRLACDWEFDSRQEGIELQLQEIQEIRSVARMIALQVRVAILERKPDEAIYWLQTGFAMGRHVSQGPILIQSLVGLSFSTILIGPMEDLIQSPGMPSLYWALANRPHPFVDLSPALEGERFVLERQVPRLRELDGLPWSIPEARAFADELQKGLFQLSGMRAPESPGSGKLGIQDWSHRMGVAALVAQAYPEAKRALIAQGRPAAVVEAMPTVQVAALNAYQIYQQYRDDVYKWAGLPNYQAFQGLQEAWRSGQSEIRKRPLVGLFTLILGSIQGGCMASARVERQLDAIECIEAVRIYAAIHHRFPSRLEEISEAPVPIDPMTGHPFGYQVEGDRATLSAPYAPVRHVSRATRSITN